MPSTLALAFGSVAILASAPFDPVHAGRAVLLSATEAEQLRHIGIVPLGQSAESGSRVAATDAVEPLAEAPVRPRGMPPLFAAPVEAPAELVPVRVRGRINQGLFEALQAAGLAPGTAGEYLRVLAAQSSAGGDIGADDHFDLVIAAPPPRAGQPIDGPLLYAAIDRVGASDVRVMRWPISAQANWVDAGPDERQSAPIGRPVAGRVTSGFGIRRHPILHRARSHRGVDIAAGTGQPIVAVADGQVARAGWAGGYGRQVRVVHSGGLATSYSHMSRIAVAPGSRVRAGQVIGYVGSSGMSTGPHLHYEVHRGGVAVNPLGVRFAGRPRIERGQADAFKAQLTQYLGLAPVRPS